MEKNRESSLEPSVREDQNHDAPWCAGLVSDKAYVDIVSYMLKVE